MPRLTAISLWFIAAILCGSLIAANTQPTIQSFNKMPLAFTRNMGQWDDRVLFRANAGGATMWFTKEGVTYQFTRTIGGHSSESWNPDDFGSGHPREGGDPGSIDALSLDSRLRGNDTERDSIQQLVLTAKFVGANPNPEVFADGQMEYKCNYFIGNDPAKWHTNVPNYEAITLKGIYPGIDLKYSGDINGQATYEFVVAPGADMAQTKVEYGGAEETSVDSDGRMIVRTKWGDMIEAIGSPASSVGLISPRVSLNSENTNGFQTGNQSLDESKSQTVRLYYSTYLGGGGQEEGHGIAVDDRGDTYVTGNTNSTNFPTGNPL